MPDSLCDAAGYVKRKGNKTLTPDGKQAKPFSEWPNDLMADWGLTAESAKGAKDLCDTVDC